MEKSNIIAYCSRCGEKFCKLGKVLEWGKHYPAIKVKNTKGEIKEYPEDTEIIKAVCKNCAKELFDKNLI